MDKLVGSVDFFASTGFILAQWIQGIWLGGLSSVAI
jgi:hypothetical protein